MKTFIKFILTLAAFILSLFPTMTAFISILAGKQGMMEFLSPIPPENFWLLGIPLFIITMAASVGTLLYMSSLIPKSQVKPVDNIRYYPALCVEDPDLGNKLRRDNVMLDTQY